MKKYIFVFMAMLAIMLAVGCTGDSPEYEDGNGQANAQAPERGNPSVAVMKCKVGQCYLINFYGKRRVQTGIFKKS